MLGGIHGVVSQDDHSLAHRWESCKLRPVSIIRIGLYDEATHVKAHGHEDPHSVSNFGILMKTTQLLMGSARMRGQVF